MGKFEAEMLEVQSLDGKKMKAHLDHVFTVYRQHKVTTFTEREASLTASYTLREGTSGGMHSDQTADIASYNVDGSKKRLAYCSRIEGFVQRLPGRERVLIQSRYMDLDRDKVNDTDVYIEMEITAKTYIAIRYRALLKLCTMLSDFGMLNLEDLRP